MELRGRWWNVKEKQWEKQESQKMIELYDKVIIKSSGVKGEVIDISAIAGKTVYIVESDEKGVPGGYGEDGGYKLFWCKEGELEIAAVTKHIKENT